MKIRFIHGFGGRETNERHYEAGEIVDFEEDLAHLLIRDGRAMLVEDEPKAPPKVVVKRVRKVKQ